MNQNLPSRPPAGRHRQAGFTILELALSLFVVGFVVAAVPALLSQDQDAASTAPGAEPVEAGSLVLNGFIQHHYRLPCPAAEWTGPGGGVEDCTRTTGFVPWRTLGMQQPLTNAAGLPFAYGIYRDAARNNHLGEATDKYTPTYGDCPGTGSCQSPDIADHLGDNRKQGGTLHYNLTPSEGYWEAGTRSGPAPVINVLDFCAKLRDAADQPPSTALLAVRNLRGTAPDDVINVPWVLIDPGAPASGALFNAFDGLNRDFMTATVFESPGRAITDTYDDRVRTGSFVQLFGELQCTERLAAMSAAAREVDFANENWRLRRFLIDFRETEFDMRTLRHDQAVAALAIGIFQSIFNVGLAATDLALAKSGVAGGGAYKLNLAITVAMTAALVVVTATNADQVITTERKVDEAKKRVEDAIEALADAEAFLASRKKEVSDLQLRGGLQ